ncbi:MAG TPA: CoA transferase [Candidatus Binataceae bacterium]|nr:CoA transferase [Candidatus Binataceae bacterium]
MAGPLEGIRVLDMSWVMVGPVSGRYLADLGADVVKIESRKRIDPLRTLGPFKDGKPGLERSVSYHNLNAGKRGLAINIKEPRGRDVILRLVDWADVVLESFTPGVLESLRLDYANLKARKPGIIMASTSILGQTGPYAQGTSGVGTMGAAMSGASGLLGWPDRAPSGTYGPWTDGVAPRFIVPSVLAALHRKSRTGEGCYIDVAQAEAGIQFMMPAYYEYAANATIPTRRGFAGSPLRCPQGVYPCAGEDRWIVIDASADTHWRKLRETLGGMLADVKYDTLIGRLRNREAIDAAISQWTQMRDAQETETMLQRAGVPAHIVSRAGDIAHDSHLRHVNHLKRIEDPEFGEAEIEGPRSSFEGSPLPETRRGPRIGEHSTEILRELCRMNDREIAELKQAGVLD